MFLNFSGFAKYWAGVWGATCFLLAAGLLMACLALAVGLISDFFVVADRLFSDCLVLANGLLSALRMCFLKADRFFFGG